MKTNKNLTGSTEENEYYKLGYERGLKDKLEGKGYEEIKSIGYRYVFLSYKDQLAVIVVRGYAKGYGIDVNDMLALYPEVEKVKEKTLYDTTLSKDETPTGYNLEQVLSEGDYCCKACAVSNYDIGFSQGRKDREAQRLSNTMPYQWGNNMFFRKAIYERGYEDGFGKNAEEISGKEQLKEGTLRADYSPATYRTKDGSGFYRFRYVNIGAIHEIDILDQPSYRHRATGAHITHRLPSARGGEKICISSGHEPTTLDAAKNISMAWAELTHTYILTGKTIDAQVANNARNNSCRTSSANSTGGTNSNNNRRGFWHWLFG